MGYIIPIFKGGDPKEAKNYRGITLNNILAKVYSQILLNRLTVWSEKYEQLSDFQFGFQKGKSTVDCVFILHSIISKVIHTGQKLYSVFIDYEKCFDKINRAFLWQKLLAEQVSTTIITAVKSMYNTVRSAIKHNGKFHSSCIDSHLGVKQGDPSSSLLFMMFVNDIMNNINSNLNGIFSLDELQLFIVLYADDQVLFSTSPTSLQSMLNDVEIYCNTFGLKINTNKTKVMIFERGRHTTHNFYLYNQQIEIVSSFKYLGIYFFKNGNWHRTQKCIAEHASKAMYRLFSIFNQYEFRTFEKSKLFDTLVASVLNYCSEIWGLNPGKDIELIHTKFCRKLLIVNKSTNLSGLYGDLGRVPLKINRQVYMIRYWIKILNMNDNALIKRIYIMLKNDANNNVTYNGSNWAYQIKSILENLGMSNLWLHQQTYEIKLHIIKQRIFDQYYQTWYADINNSRRLSTYCRFKHTFNLETHLDNSTDKKFSIALSRFRLSSHNLEIERGRYLNVPRNERICKFCNLRTIENEYHFLLICTLYTDIRKKYIKPYYCSWPTLNKFDKLMMSRNKKEISNLSKYIYFASKVRKELDQINNIP